MAEGSQWTTLCGLWQNVSKAGDQYLAGNLGMTKIMVWRNKRKKGEKSPDFWLVVVPAERENRSERQDDDPLPF